MAARKATIRDRKRERRGRVASSQPAMVPLIRCSRDPRACPASGTVVALLDRAERYECVICGRVLRFRRVECVEGQVVARVPMHRRADFARLEESRARDARLKCKLEQAESGARDAIARRAPARASRALQRAWKIAEQLPAETRVN